MIRWPDVHRRRQIEYYPLIAQASLAPCSLHRLAHLDRKLRLSLGEGLWTVFVSEHRPVLRGAFFRELPDDLGMLRGKSDRVFFGVLEDDCAEEAARGVVHVNDRSLAACDGIDGPFDEVLPGRSQDLDATVVVSTAFTKVQHL